MEDTTQNEETLKRDIILNEQIDGYKEWTDHLSTENATTAHRMFSSESYYTAFWKDAMHALAIVSEDGVIVEANDAFCNLIGIEKNQVNGINIRNLVADGEFREDMRMIDTMVLGRMIQGMTDERWNFRLQSSGPYIPVRLKAIRIPANSTRPFKHIIIQVYDLRSTKYDMQGKNWSNKSWSELLKELVMTHFGKIASLLLVLLILLGLNGQLGHVVDKVIDNAHEERMENTYHTHKNPPVDSS